MDTVYLRKEFCSLKASGLLGPGNHISQKIGLFYSMHLIFLTALKLILGDKLKKKNTDFKKIRNIRENNTIEE